MKFEMTFYIPEALKHTDDVVNTLNLLKTIRSGSIDWKTKIIKPEEEMKLKRQILWNIAISKGIKIKQTQKTKSLYPQLVVYADGEPFSFYPQSRSGKIITIEEFLEGLKRGKIRGFNIILKRRTGEYEMEPEK